MKLKIVAIVIVLVLVVVAGFYFIFSGKTEPKKLEKVTIGIQANTITSLVIIAKEKGFFSDEGLDVTIKKYPSGKLALLGMFNNESDMATTADMPIMSNSFKRSDYKIFSTIASTDQGAWIVARKDQGIKTVQDLKGKRIATQKSSAVHFFLSMFLLHNRISDKDVKLSYMKAVKLPPALVAGEIDAFSMRNPFIDRAKKDLGEKAIEFFAPGAYTQTFNLVAFNSYIKKNPKILKKIIQALIKAEQYIAENNKESIQTVAGFLGRDPSAVSAEWGKFNFKLSLDQSLLLTLEDQARWAINNGLTSKTKVPNYLKYIHSETLKEVAPARMNIIN